MPNPDLRVYNAPGPPTVVFEGVEIPDFGEARYPYAIVEVTKRCNLRCKTCFFFQAFQHEEDEMPELELIEKLRALQKRHDIQFMSFVGGEPLLRRKVVEEGAKIFPSGIVFTNGLLELPDAPIAFAISLDGPQEVNDEIRGKRVYERAMKNAAAAKNPVLVQTVVSKKSRPFMERFIEELTVAPNIAGVILSIYVPQKNDDTGLAFPMSERDELIDRLVALKDRWGPFVANERRALELARPETCKAITDACDIRSRSLALDYRLRRRLPCCYGENVDCDLCAVPPPFSIAARAEARVGRVGAGDPEHLAGRLATSGKAPS